MRTAVMRQKQEEIQKSKSYRRGSRSRRRRMLKRLRPYLISALVLGVLATVYVPWHNRSEMIQERIEIQPDKNAVNGTLHGGAVPVKAGEYQVVINQIPTMEAGSLECNIEFENPEANRYSSGINLYLKSTGACIGGTGLIEPGQYVEKLSLNEPLNTGEHPVLAKIELFRDHKPSGSLTLELTIRVVDDLSG